MFIEIESLKFKKKRKENGHLERKLKLSLTDWNVTASSYTGYAILNSSLFLDEIDLLLGFLGLGRRLSYAVNFLHISRTVWVFVVVYLFAVNVVLRSRYCGDRWHGFVESFLRLSIGRCSDTVFWRDLYLLEMHHRVSICDHFLFCMDHFTINDLQTFRKENIM